MSNQAIISKIIDPYAEALISFRIKPTSVLSLLDTLYTHQAYFLNPRVPTSSKKNALQLLKGFANPFLLRLCLLLIDREKPELICPVLEKYVKLCNAIDKIKTVTVTTTIPLEKAQKDLIITRLNKLTKAKKILLKKVVDSRILGGMVIETSTNVVDISIRNRVKMIVDFLY